MKILVLYTRLTGYWMACMHQDHKINGNEFLVIRKDPSPEAPFKISSEKGIEILDGDSLTPEEIKELAVKFNPHLLYVAGWADKRFLKTALFFRKKNISVITGMDNQWKGNLKQNIAGLLSPLLVRKYFSHIWIPGRPQHIFAHKLGFSPKNVLTGLYCADDRIFPNVVQHNYCKKIIFVGRLVEHKGLKTLFTVLEQLIQENKLDFEVHIIGNGPLANSIPQQAKIKHTTFVDPENLPTLFENAGFFILPSTYEAWGVVVHEAVLAGLPVIATHQTGAASEFLIDGHNGFIYDALKEGDLKKILLRIGKLSESEYLEMSKNSKELAGRISLDTWSATLNSVLKIEK